MDEIYMNICTADCLNELLLNELFEMKDKDPLSTIKK